MSKWELKKILVLGAGFLAGRYVWSEVIVKKNGKGFVQVDKSKVGMDDVLEALTIAGSQVLLAKFI